MPAVTPPREPGELGATEKGRRNAGDPAAAGSPKAAKAGSSPKAARRPRTPTIPQTNGRPGRPPSRFSDSDDDDGPPSLARQMQMLGCNKLHGLHGLCNKVPLSLALNFVAELFEDKMPWWPTTFVLPRDMREAEIATLRKDKAGNPAHTFIFKPDSNCGGSGVCLVQTGDMLHGMMQRKYACAVLQEYVTRPLLIDGLKWDCRVYVLVTSVSPLRVHVAREGLARFCTELYRRPTAENLDATFSHVTNYTLNKQSPTYQPAEGDPTGGRGSKRALSVVIERLARLSRTFTVEGFWAEVDHIVAMTMLVLQPELIHHAELAKTADLDEALEPGRAKFHLLGFDILLDSNERASLLELNASPSLSTQSGGYNPTSGRLEINTCAVDEAVKTAIVEGAAKIVEREGSPGAGTAGSAQGNAEPYHTLQLWHHPEYQRVRQLLQRLGRLLRHAVRPEASCGERGDGLGLARFQRFVRESAMLSTRPERPRGGSTGTIVPALTPKIVESIYRGIVSSGGKATKSQPEYIKLGLLLREIARHQSSRSKTPPPSFVDLLDKSARKLEAVLGTSSTEAEQPDAKLSKASGVSRPLDAIDAAASSASRTLDRMSQLVKELERKSPSPVEDGRGSPAERRDAGPPPGRQVVQLLPGDRPPAVRRGQLVSRLARPGSGGASRDRGNGSALSLSTVPLPRTPPSVGPGARGHERDFARQQRRRMRERAAGADPAEKRDSGRQRQQASYVEPVLDAQRGGRGWGASTRGAAAMSRMTWSLSSLQEGPLQNFSSIDRPPKKGARKERGNSEAAATRPRWAQEQDSFATNATTTNAWRERLMSRGLN